MTSPTAVVSGGTRGIGLALSLRLTALGYRVIAPYRSDKEAARQAEAAGEGRIEALCLDVADATSVREGCRRILDEYGAPEVLVNNAGRNRDRPFAELTDEDWDEVLATNLSGPFRMCRALAPAMVAAGRGTIVNIGSTTAIRPRRDGANYCASKAGLLHLTKCLALELAPTVRVNALIPGFTDTPEVTERYGLDVPEKREAIVRSIPRNRIGTTADIADALEFLVASGSSYITGQQLIVDGGHFMG
ncbi:short-chain dehydrogenase [Streptomyces sp. CB02923]|uniref:SDR family NAD(P)-dependent oxidoreductase n=1 Tax=Streptomyces sp. CB02923 TaxID=1718985 RepID=UPI00093D762C|nr:SDR family NAD(P)-dependent oxidoreductase [Streptomyces sp. CB02923]OKI08087.1 short-chain dehydrogenase [Streptomyces sp. CB02923]